LAGFKRLCTRVILNNVETGFHQQFPFTSSTVWPRALRSTERAAWVGCPSAMLHALRITFYNKPKRRRFKVMSQRRCVFKKTQRSVANLVFSFYILAKP